MEINWNLYRLEENKLASLNILINDLYNKKKTREKKKKSPIATNNKSYILHIVLLELIPKEDATLLRIPNDWVETKKNNNASTISFSPQELLLNKVNGGGGGGGGIKDEICTNTFYQNVCDIIVKNNNNNNGVLAVDPTIIIGNLVTLYGMKNVWVNEDDLVKCRILKLFAQLTLKDMEKMLRTSPYPFLCLSKKKKIINNVKTFINIVNKTCENDNFALFDFTPYIRYKHHYLRPQCIYRLCEKIELVDKMCFMNCAQKTKSAAFLSFCDNSSSDDDNNSSSSSESDDHDSNNVVLTHNNQYKPIELWYFYAEVLNDEDWDSLLDPQKMVSTTIVSLYLQHLSMKYSSVDNNNNIVIWPHDIYVTRGGGGGGVGLGGEERVIGELPKMWNLTNIEERKDSRGIVEVTAAKEYDFVLIPVCIDQHFFLIVFSFQEKTTYILNPMGSEHSGNNTTTTNT